MSSRPHRSIGEVLALLQDDFPDVTISKIRFLESQGLLDPERTPSGYRKFYDRDIETLRWVLEQQRDHFLPLKVIKERLDEAGDVPAPETPRQSVSEIIAAARSELPADPDDASVTKAVALSSVSLTAEELAAATSLDVPVIAELAKYGIITGDNVNGVDIFDDTALVAARLASGFLDRGLDPRHLRGFKLAADREVDMIEQLIGPRTKGVAPDEVARRIGDLVALGAEMRATLVDHALSRR